jgi:hypothetical protein
MTMRTVQGRWLGWAAAGLMALVASPSAQAGGGLYAWLTGHHTIPRETLAKDYRTGGVYYAPPIPYGEYAKDYAGCVHAAAGMLAGAAHGVIGKVCGLCGGKGCGACGGQGCQHGNACGGCGGSGHGLGGGACGGCGGTGILTGIGGHLAGKMCGLCGGLGRGAHGGACGGCGGAGAIVAPDLGGHKGGRGLFGHKHKGGGMAAPVVAASPQVMAAPQAIAAGHAVDCGLCGGKGKLRGALCGGCGGKGLIGGMHGHGHGGGGSACGGCGGDGIDGHGGTCGACGGCGLLGCAAGAVHHVAGTAAGAAHHVAGTAHGLATHVGYKLGHGGVEYFVGPGGPVPITPGYVPYINPVRSPRDYFAFPPFSENAGVGQMDP